MISKENLMFCLKPFDHYDKDIDYDYWKEHLETKEKRERILKCHSKDDDTYEFKEYAYSTSDGRSKYRQSKLFKEFQSFKKMIFRDSKKAVALLKEVWTEFLEEQKKLEVKDWEELYLHLLRKRNYKYDRVITEDKTYVVGSEDWEMPCKVYEMAISKVTDIIGYEQAYKWIRDNYYKTDTYNRDYDRYDDIFYIKVKMDIKEEYLSTDEVKNWMIKNGLESEVKEKYEKFSYPVNGNFFDYSYYGITAVVHVENAEITKDIEVKFLYTYADYCQGGWN